MRFNPKQMNILATFVLILSLLTACGSGGGTVEDDPATEPAPTNQTSTKRPPDFPDYRDDVGWDTTKERDTGRNPYRDNPNPNAGKDAWLHGIDKKGNRIGDGVYDANQHDTLKDMNSDGILDGNDGGYNQTPLLDNERLDWFDGEEYDAFN